MSATVTRDLATGAAVGTTRRRHSIPIAIRLGMENWGAFLFSGADINNLIPNLRLIGFGGLIIVFLVLEPEGLNRLWRNIRTYFRVWPFSY